MQENPREPQRTGSGRVRGQRSPRVWIVAAVAAVLVGAFAFIGVGLYTDRPEYCATCHEMRPYYNAWRQGHHRDTWCVDCHVGKSYPLRVAHKFLVLGELVAHFRGDTTFPRVKAATVADRQCVRCHANVPSGTASGFNHAAHAQHGPCQACHAKTGHDVPPAALTAAGVFNPNVEQKTLIGAFAVVDKGSANVPGHVAIPCTRCHDLAQTGCQRCHTPKHTKSRPGPCQLCHQPGLKFVFTHPTGEDCSQCHTPSATHFKPPGGELKPCTRCHTQPGKSWAFTHPTSVDCSQCHDPGAKHFQPASGDLKPCSRCHKQPGKSWAFAHPAASANCLDCHAVPAQHNPPASTGLSPCTRCHANVGDNWAFKHPSASADCKGCHTPPANHYPGQCSACHHQPGVTFVFSHPSAGEHSYTSRPCAKCHPNGPPDYFCTCHNNRTGPRG